MENDLKVDIPIEDIPQAVLDDIALNYGTILFLYPLF